MEHVRTQFWGMCQHRRTQIQPDLWGTLCMIYCVEVQRGNVPLQESVFFMIKSKYLWYSRCFYGRSDYIKCESNCVTVLWQQAEKVLKIEQRSRFMWLTRVSGLRLLAVRICIQSDTWRTQQPRQTLDRWIIRCVRLLSGKVSAEIERHFKHQTGVYWEGARM